MRYYAIIPVAIFVGGCMARPQQAATQTPVSTTEAPVTAEQIENLTQKITQVQNTLSVQTTNFARDAEQAKTDRIQNRSKDKYVAATIAVLGAFALFGFCTGATLKGKARGIALLVVGSLIVGAPLALMFWPY